MASTPIRLDVLAFGAHPDDVELFCSGTLIRLQTQGYATGVYSLTRGELGTRGSTDVRVEEFRAGAALMGASAHGILDIPDGQVATEWNNKLKVIRVIRAHRPALVLAPYWEDRHPDHVNSSHLVRESAFLAGLTKIDTGQEAYRPCQLIYYPCWAELEPSFIVDISESQDRKMEAIAAHHSQLHEPGQPETPVSDPRFMERLLRRTRRYGAAIGVSYGEAFLVTEPLYLEDPVQYFKRYCRDKMPRGL